MWLLAALSLSFFTGSLVAAESTETPATPVATGEQLNLADVPGASPVKKGAQSIHPDSTFKSIEKYLIHYEKFSEAEAEVIAKEIIGLFLEMRREGRNLEATMPGEDFEERLERGRLTMKRDDLGGRAKVTKVDGVKWIKVIHKKSQTAFLFFNQDKVQLDSEHAHLILSNMHFNGGKHVLPEDLPDPKMQKARRRGALFGRNVAVSMYHERDGNPEDAPVIESVHHYSKPAKGTDRYKYEFKLACDKPFSWGNIFVNGTLIGTAQVGVLVALNHLSPHIPFLGGHMEPLNPFLLAFTFAYSHYAGGWLYPKLRARSQSLTYSARFWLRGLTISLPYAIVYKAFVTQHQLHDAMMVGALPVLGYFLRQGVNIGINFFINNRVSNELNEHTQLDQELRTQRGNLEWFEKYLGLKVRRIDYKGQERYVAISFTSRTVDLNDNFKGFEIPLPALDSHYFLSAGKIMYLGLAPLLRYTVMKRAEKSEAPSAPQYRARWEKSLTARTIKGVNYALKSPPVQFIGNRLKAPCAATLRSLSKLSKILPSSRSNGDFSDLIP